MLVVRPVFHGFNIVSRIGDRPITALDFAQHMKIDEDLLDGELLAYVNLLIDYAVEYCEKYTRRTIISSNVKGYLDFFNCGSSHKYELRVSPIASITSLKYFSNGTLATIESENYYFTKSNAFPMLAPVSGHLWPVSDDRLQSVEIELVAGYTSATLPPMIKAGLLAHVAAMYANRGDCVNSTKNEIPPMVWSAYNGIKIKEYIMGV